MFHKYLIPTETSKTCYCTNDAIKFWMAMIACATVALSSLDSQLTGANMRYICGGLSISLDESTWSSAAYLLNQISGIVLAKAFVFLFSRRRILLFAMLLFIFSQVVTGLSFDLTSFSIGRALAGFSTGLVNWIAIVGVLTDMPKDKRLYGFLLFGLPTTQFVPLGYLLGGFLVNHANWRDMYFLAGVPAICLCTILYYLAPVECTHEEPASGIQPTWYRQWFAFLTIFVMAGSLSIAVNRGTIDNWLDSPAIVTELLVAAIAAIVFFATEFISKTKLTDFALFLNAPFIAMICVNFLFGSLLNYTTILSNYLQNIADYDSQQVGETIWLSAITVPFITVIMRKVDHRLLLFIGLILIAVSGFDNSMLNQYLIGHDFSAAQIFRAVGQTFVLWPIFAVVMSHIPANKYQPAAQFYSLSRALGIAFAGAALGASLTARDNFHSEHAIDRVSPSALTAETQRLENDFKAHGSERHAAKGQALIAVRRSLTTETRVRAYSDLFWLVGMTAVLATLPILLTLKKPKLTLGRRKVRF